MLLYRILSAIVGIPVFLAAFWYGRWPLLITIGIIIIAGILELYRFWQKLGIKSWLPGMILGGILFLIPAYLGSERFIGLIFTIILFLNLLYMVIKYPVYSFTDVAANFGGAVYVGWLLSHLIFLQKLPGGFHYAILLLATTWSTDTAAYFVGMNFGRRKLAPGLSPKKTVEGSLGGVAGSVLAALVVGLITPRMAFYNYIFVGLLVGVVGQVGDLFESALKRQAGIKDSGTIIPGHGGVLDRFDSMLFTAPVVYYYVQMFIIN